MLNHTSLCVRTPGISVRVYRNLNFQNIHVSQKDKPSFDAKDSVPISAGDIILLLSAVSKYAFLFKSITV